MRVDALTEWGVVHILAVNRQHGSNMVKSRNNPERIAKRAARFIVARRPLAKMCQHANLCSVFHCFGVFFLPAPDFLAAARDCREGRGALAP